MEITREVISQRIEALREQRDALITNVHVFGGAIQMSEEWLAFLDSEEPQRPELTVVPDIEAQ